MERCESEEREEGGGGRWKSYDVLQYVTQLVQKIPRQARLRDPPENTRTIRIVHGLSVTQPPGACSGCGVKVSTCRKSLASISRVDLCRHLQGHATHDIAHFSGDSGSST